MAWYLWVYIVGAVIFYIGAAAMYLHMEDRVTLLTLLVALFLFAPFTALLWPLVWFSIAIDQAGSCTLWEKRY